MKQLIVAIIPPCPACDPLVFVEHFSGKGTTFFICVSRPAHALISASGEKKKNFKENA